jgi:hypothetical protein
MVICNQCGKTSNEVPFNFNGHRDAQGDRVLRSKCVRCEIASRLKAKRNKLKAIKNRATHHGGSASSRQKVRAS